MELWLQAAVHIVVLSVVQSPALVSGSASCYRWNCPCPGDNLVDDGASIRLTKRRLEGIYNRAQHIRLKTRQLLNRIEHERFLRNRQHVTSLKACMNSRHTFCFGTHLNGQCHLEELPQVVQQTSRSPRLESDEVNNFLQDMQVQIAALAIHIQQAREDELNLRNESLHSLGDDIRYIEEEGLYYLLCELRLHANANQLQWRPNLTPETMDVDCRNFSERAPTDNRNFMVFYTLDKLLHNISATLGSTVSREKRSYWRLVSKR